MTPILYEFDSEATTDVFLTHLPLDEMAVISETTHFLEWKYYNFDSIFTEICS